MIAGYDGMLDGFRNKSILLIPLGSAAMQSGEQMGKLVFKAFPEDVREEMELRGLRVIVV